MTAIGRGPPKWRTPVAGRFNTRGSALKCEIGIFETAVDVQYLNSGGRAASLGGPQWLAPSRSGVSVTAIATVARDNEFASNFGLNGSERHSADSGVRI
jgi:hypothetical protein